MKISVIVPIYNTGKYLIRCVESLCGQTWQELQIILINDGSSDDSLEIMKELAAKDERIHIIDKAHEGVSAARNAGLAMAEGEYISFIDSDDWLNERTYEKCLNAALQNNADAVYFEWTEEFSDGTSEINGYDGSKTIVLKGNDVLTEYYKDKISMRVSSGFLSRKIVENVWFDTSRERGEDMLFGFYALCKAKCVVYMNEPFYHRYHRVGSLSNRKGFYLADFGRATCTDCMLEYIKEHKPNFIQLAYTKCFNYYMIMLNRLVYFRAEKEYEEVYSKVVRRLQELMKTIKNPAKTLPKQLYVCYRIYGISPLLYYFVVKVYYKYVKKELDSKRQR